MRTVLLLASLTAAVSVGAGASSLRVKSVEAHLFLQNTGILSPTVKPDMALWNTVIGEGAAGEPSTSTLIDVIVEGAPGSYSADAQVILVVTSASTGKVKLRLVQHVGVLSKSGVSHIPFWLADTGCEALKVMATLGDTKGTTDVQFACGE